MRCAINKWDRNTLIVTYDKEFYYFPKARDWIGPTSDYGLYYITYHDKAGYGIARLLTKRDGHMKDFRVKIYKYHDFLVYYQDLI